MPSKKMSLETSKILKIIKNHLKDPSVESSEIKVSKENLNKTQSLYLMRYEWFKKKSKKDSFAYDNFINSLNNFKNKKNEIYLVRLNRRKERKEFVYYINDETKETLELPIVD
jgi:hypothetical protein